MVLNHDNDDDEKKEYVRRLVYINQINTTTTTMMMYHILDSDSRTKTIYTNNSCRLHSTHMTILFIPIHLFEYSIHFDRITGNKSEYIPSIPYNISIRPSKN